MLNRVCCFLGYRGGIPKDKKLFVVSSIEAAVRELIKIGYSRFVSTFCDNSDIIWVNIISRMKVEDPNIILEAWVPYRDCITNGDENFHLSIAECDVVNIKSEKFDPVIYNKSFRDMIDESDAVIAVFDGKIDSEIYNNLKYAYECNKQIKVIEI